MIYIMGKFPSGSDDLWGTFQSAYGPTRSTATDFFVISRGHQMLPCDGNSLVIWKSYHFVAMTLWRGELPRLVALGHWIPHPNYGNFDEENGDKTI